MSFDADVHKSGGVLWRLIGSTCRTAYKYVTKQLTRMVTYIGHKCCSGWSLKGTSCSIRELYITHQHGERVIFSDYDRSVMELWHFIYISLTYISDDVPKCVCPLQLECILRNLNINQAYMRPKYTICSDLTYSNTMKNLKIIYSSVNRWHTCLG